MLGWLGGIYKAITGTLAVSVQNTSLAATGQFYQSTQPVSGTVSVGNFPATQPVSGTIADSNSAAFQGVVAITPGTATTALRSLGFIITAAGNVTLTLADNSTLTIPLQTSGGAFQVLPFAVTNVALGSGTAGSFWNLK